MTDLERLEAKYIPEPNSGCWLWLGATIRGYGAFRFRGKVDYAHRAAFVLERGPIPDGLDLDHLCRTPLCVNPAHLEPVTHAENVRRGLSGKVNNHQRAKEACPKGHAYDAENTMVIRGSRHCRECSRRRRREWYANRQGRAS